MFTLRRDKNIHLKVSAGRMLQIEATKHDLLWLDSLGSLHWYASVSLGWGRGQAFLKTNQPKLGRNRLRAGLVSLVSLSATLLCLFSPIAWYQWRRVQPKEKAIQITVHLPGRGQETEPLYSVESFRISASFFRVLSSC